MIRWYLCLLILVTMIALCCSQTIADDTAIGKPSIVGGSLSTVSSFSDAKTPRYCGLMCVYASTNALELPIDFSSIVDANNLEREYGSSSHDLVDCLDALGLHGPIRS